MAKVLLINPSYARTYGSTLVTIANPVYPVLSLAVLAGMAKAKGHQVRILDLSYRLYDPSFLREVILQEKPEVIGITATTPLVNQMRDISFLVKEISKEILTVGGGPHPSSLPRETLLESRLDMVAAGEADHTFLEILEGKNPSDIPGLYYRKGEDVMANLPRPLLNNLDDLPMPAWELYPMHEYRGRISRIVARCPPLSTIEFSRGCVYRCDFCASKNTMGMGYRKKSPKRCAEELAYLQKLGYREVLLCDDIFTSDNQWAAEVCEAILRRGIRMAWSCTNGIRVDSANDRLFRLMKRAGCYKVHFGFESGNDEVLQRFGKGGKATLVQGMEAVKKARAAGLETCGMYLVGLLPDTEASMRDTVQYAKKTKVDLLKIGVTVPFPGTPMFYELLKMGRIKTLNWDQYNVYNEACALFDHPSLSWDTIMRCYRESYTELYFKNPSYVARRLWTGLKNGEFFWDLYYALQFARYWKSRIPALPERENYAYQAQWEALNISPEAIQFYEPQKARKVP